MKKSIKVHPKKSRGRPATGKNPLISARVPPALIVRIEKWADTNEVTRSESIRSLMELGLTVKPASRPSAKAASRAAELAAKVIDRHIDSKTLTEQREVRKRRLLKGPSVFRDFRKDLAK
jgi:hypothetical protein